MAKDLEFIRQKIRTVPGFPKPEIQFLDLSPALSSGFVFQQTIEHMAELVTWSQIDVVIGIESRGFILGSALALQNKKGFVPCRKAGKLPPPVFAESYALEYGSATLELQPGSGRALIVDDVLATGGTLSATIKIAEKAGFQTEELLVLINIGKLNSMKWKGQPVKALLEY